MEPEPAHFRAERLRTGLTARFERDISEQDVLAFARLSGDRNPLHVDPEYALTTNYGRRLVHGAFQVSLASRMVGMHLPGREVLLGSITSRFPAPLGFPCRVVVTGELTAWNPAAGTGQVKVLVTEAESAAVTAEILMGIKLHERREALPRPAPPAALDGTGLPRVLVTGASGGIGRELVASLAPDHRVLALVHRAPLDGGLGEHPNVQELRIDLQDPLWEETLAGPLGPEPLYGVVHAAWPSLPRGSLLQAPRETLESQAWFGVQLTVRLAKLLFDHGPAQGGRMVAISSVAGSTRPMLAMGAYSLAKAGMDHSVRLLAPELARKRITINALCPDFVPVGLNQQADQLARKKVAAQVPMGRLCEPGDLAGMVRFLLSKDAGFLSGQVIALTGGQL